MFEHNWLMILAVLVFLVGSLTWAMPTSRQRQQARLRQQAVAMGIQVRIAHLHDLCKDGAVASSRAMIMGYYLARIPVCNQSRAKLLLNHDWQIYRSHRLHGDGLPSGWCWNRGEGNLGVCQLDYLDTILKQLPDDIYAVGSNPLAVVVYWHESGGQQCLNDIHVCLQQLLK